jgi:two-component system sensor histidine kinase QseC
MSVYSIRTLLGINLLLSIILIALVVIIDNFYLAHRNFQHETYRELMNYNAAVRSVLAKYSYIPQKFGRKDKISQQIMYSMCRQKLSNLDEHSLSIFSTHHFFALVDTEGNVLAQSNQAPSLPQTIKNEELETIQANGKHWRIEAHYDPVHQYHIVVGEQTDALSFLKNSRTRELITIILGSYLILGLLIWMTIQRSVAFIKSVTQDLTKRNQNSLEPINIHHAPIELNNFVKEINRLLHCLHEALEREKRFAADASHELKTVLTSFYTQAEVGLQTNDSTEKNTMFKKILLGTKRSVHLIQQLLALSRTLPETTIYTTFIKDNIIQHAETVINKMKPHAEKKNITLSFHYSEPSILMMCNGTAIEVLIRNLLDNAVTYTPKNGSVSLHITKQPHHIILSVIDSGPGIPKHLREKVFDRFFRIVDSQSTGSGLGMSIIKQIVSLHHAEISLLPAKGNTGLHVKIIFPCDILPKK